MAGKVLETMIRIAGQVESSLKKSIKDVCSQMDRMRHSRMVQGLSWLAWMVTGATS